MSLNTIKKPAPCSSGLSTSCFQVIFLKSVCVNIIFRSVHRTTLRWSSAVSWRIPSVRRAALSSWTHSSQISQSSYHVGCCLFFFCLTVFYYHWNQPPRCKNTLKPTYSTANFPASDGPKMSTGLTVLISLLGAVLVLVLLHRWKAGENFHFHSINIFCTW